MRQLKPCYCCAARARGAAATAAAKIMISLMVIQAKCNNKNNDEIIEDAAGPFMTWKTSI